MAPPGDSDLASLGTKIRRARQRANVTQQRAADIAKVELRTMSRLENGGHNPTYLCLLKLAKGLHVPLGDLILPTKPEPTRRGRPTKRKTPGRQKPRP